MTTSAACATSSESLSSNPYCLDAIAGLRATANVDCVKGVGRLYDVISIIYGQYSVCNTRLKSHFRAPTGLLTGQVHTP